MIVLIINKISLSVVLYRFNVKNILFYVKKLKCYIDVNYVL